MSETPEQKARQKIDAQPVACGWTVQDYKQFNPSAGRGIALREAPLKSGICDYLLLVDRKAVGVIEAKKEGTLLSGVAEQSEHYAENLPEFIQSITPGILPFLYESTGIETFFRDERDPEPRSRRLFSFHRPETLAALAAEADTLRRRLAELPTAHPLPEQHLRACQIEGITNLEQSFAAAHPRALVQMATGAGKTYTACSFTYRLIKHAGAKNMDSKDYDHHGRRMDRVTAFRQGGVRRGGGGDAARHSAGLWSLVYFLLGSACQYCAAHVGFAFNRLRLSGVSVHEVG